MRLKMNKILIFFYISFSISIAQRPITSEDIVNLKTVSQASFDSDGSKIVLKRFGSQSQMVKNRKSILLHPLQ